MDNRNGNGRWNGKKKKTGRKPGQPFHKSPTYSSENIAKAIVASRGVMAKAAKKVGMSISALFLRIRAEPALKEAMDEARQVCVSVAFEGMLKDAARGDHRACGWIFAKWGHLQGLEPPPEASELAGRPVVILQVNEIPTNEALPPPKQVEGEVVDSMLAHVNEVIVDAENVPPVSPDQNGHRNR